jgi:hypothetical protein
MMMMMMMMMMSISSFGPVGCGRNRTGVCCKILGRFVRNRSGQGAGQTWTQGRGHQRSRCAQQSDGFKRCTMHSTGVRTSFVNVHIPALHIPRTMGNVTQANRGAEAVRVISDEHIPPLSDAS